MRIDKTGIERERERFYYRNIIKYKISTIKEIAVISMFL
jgi:hypothetical protein